MSAILRRVAEVVRPITADYSATATPADPAAVELFFGPTATPQQQADALAAVAALNKSAAATLDWVQARTGHAVVRHAMVRLANTVTNSTTTLADAVPGTGTGLRFFLKPNTHYSFRFEGAYTTAVNTTRLSLAVNGPASPAVLGVVGEIWTSATARQGGVGTSYNAPLTGANAGGATRLAFKVIGNITTGAAGGMFVLRFASSVAGSAVNILQGAEGELKEVEG